MKCARVQIQRAAIAYWTIFLLLTVHLNFVACNESSEPNGISNDQSSARLLKLLLIAARLREGRLYRDEIRNSLHGEDAYKEVDSRPWAYTRKRDSSNSTADQQSVFEVLNRYIRQNADPNLQIFKDRYKIFYKNMESFITELPSKFNPGTNDIMQNIALIPTIMRPSHPDFEQVNTKNILKRIQLVLVSMQILINNVSRLVKDEEQDWLETYYKTLKKQVGDLLWRLPNFLSIAESNIPVTAGGISSFNTGAKLGIDEEVIKLLEKMAWYLESGVI